MSEFEQRAHYEWARANELEAEVERLLAENRAAFEAGYSWAALRKGTPEQGYEDFVSSRQEPSGDPRLHPIYGDPLYRKLETDE